MEEAQRRKLEMEKKEISWMKKGKEVVTHMKGIMYEEKRGDGEKGMEKEIEQAHFPTRSAVRERASN